MERILVVNADDFGLSKEQNYGIVEVCRDGVVTPITTLVNGAAIDYAVQLNRDIPTLVVGMHFVLTPGRPLTAMPGLTHDGLLGKWIRQMAEEDTLPLDEISQKLATQYQHFTDLFERGPTHLNSHHRAHTSLQVFPIVAGLAAKKRTASRIDHQAMFQVSDFPETLRTSQRFSSELYGETISEVLFLQTLDASADRGEPSLEVMCHPAFIDDTIRQSICCYPRLTELDVLTSSSLRYVVVRRGYRLGSPLSM